MITPLALIGLVSLPIIVAYYMLRLRRRDVPVGSTFLWQQLVRDIEANAPWQRLRFSWLLIVQLLIALVAVLAAARPFLTVSSDLAANVVLIVDTSASMGTLEAGTPRMAQAQAAARRVIGQLPEGGHVTVVAADDSAHVLVSDTDDRSAAIAAIDRIEATQVPGDLTDAFALASALAARDSDSTVVVVTDANADRLPHVGIGAPVHVERVGATDANQAVAALSLLRRSGGAQLDLFVAVSNPSGSDVTRRLEIYADDLPAHFTATSVDPSPGSAEAPDQQRALSSRWSRRSGRGSEFSSWTIAPLRWSPRPAPSAPCWLALATATWKTPSPCCRASSCSRSEPMATPRPWPQPTRPGRRTGSSSSTAPCRPSRRRSRPCTSDRRQMSSFG